MTVKKLTLDYSEESRQQMIEFVDWQIQKTWNLQDRAELADIRDKIKTDDNYFHFHIDRFKERVEKGDYDQYKVPDRKH